MSGGFCLLLFVTLERLGELWLAKYNTKMLLAKGALEIAPNHYPAIVLLHAAWISGLWLLAYDQPVNPKWLAVFGALQILRFWTLTTLGKRWTTRIIFLPQEPLVKTGPYRFLSHPNYVVVIGEIAVLPLCFGLPYFALIFSVLNAIILAIRIKAENTALHGSGNEIR